ncbi:fungal-specific transcription factor domain-containing protein [Hypoxylon argillaceum]|nr:fungal-specific transcription factor domain-containing protein [Hypoxylon argillaceum]
MGAKRQSGTEGTRSTGIAERPSSEAAPPKRQRVSRACDQCRAAREKCDGIQPLCFPCASQNRPCSWEEPKKKRGVQTGYIRTLEMALGWIFDKIPESENALHGLLTHEGGQGRLLLAGKDTSASTRLHRRWRKSTVHAEIERVLSGDAASTRSANDSTPGEESGEDGTEKDMVAAARHKKSTSVLSESTDHPKAELSDRIQTRGQWHEHLTTREASSTNLLKSLPNLPSPPQPRPPSTLRLPSNHWRLLDIYFSYTHIWFPILEKHELLKTGYSYPDVGLGIAHDTPGSAGHAELWAALALASYQETASRAGRSLEEGPPDPTYMKPREIYHIARNLIPTEDGFFESRHINALLLLTLINMACNDLKAAWMLTGMATRVALSLRLHENSGSAQHRQSSHTYMGCFVIDTLLSARMGLLPHLRSDMAHISPPCLENDLDEWQPWMPCSDFGPSERDRRPSRMPSHSISSFGILHRIHFVLSHRLWYDPKNSLQSEDAFLHTLQSAVSRYGVEASLSNYVLTGEGRTGQLPSIHLLRLAFLYATTGQHHAVLNCIEGYMNDFGVCGLSPLLPVFMKLIDRRVDSNSLTGEERGRWNQIEKAIESVWTKPGTGVEDINSTYYRQQSNTASQSITSTHLQPSSTTPIFHPNTNITHSSTNMNIPFPHNPSVTVPQLVDHQPPPETETHPLDRRSADVREFEDLDTLTIPPSMHFPGVERPSFNSATLDYDTILDDIASFERTNVPESDSQFMANLGLRPGTNLADVFSHEFMGFS